MSGRMAPRRRLTAALLALLGVLGGCHRAPPALAPASKGSAAPQEVSLLEGPLEGRRWLERDANIATSRGAGPLRAIIADVGADGDRIGAFVAIPSDQCLLAYARGSFGVDDLDLYAYGDDGTTLAADEAADPHPTILVCPPHPSRAYIVARVAAGRGIVAIGVHPVAAAAAPLVGKALGARGSPGEEGGRVEAWPGLDERVNQHRRGTGVPWVEMRRVAVQADARAPTRLSALLEAGRCIDVLAIPGEELSQLEVVMLDGDGRIVARAAPLGRDRAAIVCSPVQTPISVELRPHAGQGLCAVVLSRSTPGTETQIEGAVQVHRVAATTDLTGARAGRGKILRTLGYGDAVSVGSGNADVGKRISFPVDLPEGCSRVDVVAGRPLAGIAADLWDSSGALVASAESGEGPTLFACGKGGHARIDVEATARPGPLAIELRRERTAPVSLVAHPLAGSRLLASLNGRGDTVSVGAASDARVIPLDATSLKTFEILLPDGRCGDVVAALDAGGSGIDLRLVDVRTGQEHSLVRGRTVAATNVCTAGGPRQLRAELRLSAGKADALVVTRLIPILPSR